VILEAIFLLLLLLLFVIGMLQGTGHPPNSDGLVKAPAVDHAAIGEPAPGRLDAFDGALVASDDAHLGQLAGALTAPQADGLVGGAGAEQVPGDAEAQHGGVVRPDVAREGPARGGPAAEAVPGGDVAVGARGVEPAVVGGDGERVPRDAVAGDEDALEEMRRLPLLPGLDAAVGGGGVDDAGVCGDGVDGVVVGADGLEAPEVGDAPDLERAVPGARVEERGVVHGDGEAGDAVGVLDPEAAVVGAARRRGGGGLHVAVLAEHPAQVVPGGGQRGDELEGVLGAAAAGDAPDADAAVLVRGEDAAARGRQRLDGAAALAVAEAREAPEVGLLPRHDVAGRGRAEQELPAEGEAGDGARVVPQHRQRLARPRRREGGRG
jgi:hypothetical protein